MRNTEIHIYDPAAKEKVQPRRIEFHLILANLPGGPELGKSNTEPNEYCHIDLIALNGYKGRYDIMYAYDSVKNKGDGVVYLGKWNDGIV